jgi:hypothetical protein
MIALLLVAMLAVLHTGVYVLVLRNRARYARSATLFRYHVGFAAAIGLLFPVWLSLTPAADRVAMSVAVIAFSGIYSLSFLEMWALADGGYSIAILRYLHGRPAAEPDCIARFSCVGRVKQQQRLESLVALGLARRSGDALTVTRRGRGVATAADVLLRFSNVRERG